MRSRLTAAFLPAALLLAALVLATSCAVAPDGPPSLSPSARAMHEQAMNARWQNHTLAELVRDRGTPRDTMTIPGGGNPAGFITVYERDPQTGCVDAFALVYAVEPVIRNYYCR